MALQDDPPKDNGPLKRTKSCAKLLSVFKERTGRRLLNVLRIGLMSSVFIDGKRS